MRQHWRLSWPDVDPATHGCDPVAARAVVEALLPRPAESLADRSDWPAGWVDLVTTGFVEALGRWASGWHWSREYAGGPVVGWCCPTHSMTTAAETADRVVGALLEWHGWLRELSAEFTRLAPEPGLSADDRRAAWERALAQLITTVAVRTEAYECWQVHCEQVLNWFLVFTGFPQDEAEGLVAEAVGGRFESWCPPEPDLVHAVADATAERAATSYPR